MKRDATAALLSFCFYAAAAVSRNDSTETVVAASPGDVVILPCYAAGNVTPSLTTWTKDGREVPSGGAEAEAAAGGPPRLAVLHDGSLNIRGATPADEGVYLCDSTLAGNVSFRAQVELLVAAGPENVSVSVSPATVLSNGTLITYRGSTVSFNCSASSRPSQRLTWDFAGPPPANHSLASAVGAWLGFRIENIQPSAQGLYSCMAQNSASHQAVNKSTQLLVYYVPDRHPDCSWGLAQDPSHVQFTCTWSGAYPAPTLQWVEDRADRAAYRKERVFASEVTDSLPVTMNRSMLSSGQTLRCTAQHLALAAGQQKSCLFTLNPPYPDGEPLVTALEGTSVTLTCTESTSIPPANTTWRKGLQQEEVTPGWKYAVSVEGPVLKLTILNVSKEDEGLYFCRSENPVAVRELEVYLTVKTSSAYTGVIIGVFIAALIVGSAIVVAKVVYSSRHQICLGGGFGQLEEDRGDVLSLVESDDEPPFLDAVPRLPPVANGHQTTLVQIHRIPSSDHEDAETADAGPRQREEDAHADGPVDLVTF